MNDGLLYGFPVAVLTTGVVEVIKRTGYLPDKFAPLAAMLVAIALSVALSLGHAVVSVDAVLGGIMFGLAASGLYSGVAAMAEK
jgi:hypothetical protein